MLLPNHLFGEQMMPSLVRCADDFGRHTSSNASKSKIKWPQEAVKEVHGWLKKGLRVVDADLSGYFDTIPHGQLMKSLGRRISDGESPVPSRRCLRTDDKDVDTRQSLTENVLACLDLESRFYAVLSKAASSGLA